MKNEFVTLRFQFVQVIGFFLTLLAAGASLVNVRSTIAEEFRVESKVYAGKDDAPTSESTTLFDDGRVYDFLSSPHEVTVFDFPRGRIVLLDATRKVRTELTTEKLNEFTEQLRTRATRQTDPLLKFSADPQFDDSRGDDDWLQFTSPLITYRVHPAPSAHSAVVHDYRTFSDWSARLKAMIHPGALPPFPRLAVNESLEHAGKLPQSVELSLGSQNRFVGKPTTMRSEHTFTMRLRPMDHKRIDEAGHDLVSFAEVSLEEYLRPADQADRKNTATK